MKFWALLITILNKLELQLKNLNIRQQTLYNRPSIICINVVEGRFGNQKIQTTEF